MPDRVYAAGVPAAISELTGLEYDRLRLSGCSRSEAASRVGVSAGWATKRDRSLTGGSSIELAQMTEALSEGLDELALACLDDFGLFRETYLSHVGKAWMSEAADTVWRLYETPNPEMCIINCPPGVGKSTFLQDLFTWLIVKNRRIRCLYGADTQENAAAATGLIKSYLEAVEPPFANPKKIASGEAVQSTRTLSADFGLFRPDSERGGVWREDRMRVRFDDEFSRSTKEATLTAFGRKGGVMGNRFEVVGWDDLQTEDIERSPTQQDRLNSDWDGGLGESRLEPDDNGLLFIVGQRIGPRDLYRYNLDKKVTEWVDGKEADRQQYTHIMFPAHFDDACVGVHQRGVARSWPHGCLLDAERLPYYGSKGIKSKMDNSPRAYAVQYQQQDGSADDSLVHHTWVWGGRDSDGVERPGCLNRNRTLRQVPAHWDRGEIVSLVSIDPSPTKYWAVQWWAINLETNERALMDLVDRKMRANDVFDYIPDRATPYTGLLEEWVWRSKESGLPIQHIVLEINAAQRFFDERKVWWEWLRARGLSYRQHTTARNKADPELGLSLLIEPYRSGWVDLPYGDVAARVATETLARQLTQTFDRNDQLMANWFMELNYAKLRAPRKLPLLPRASWQRRRAG